MATIAVTRDIRYEHFQFIVTGKPCFLAQNIRLVGPLPGRVQIVAPEVPVGCRRLVDRPAQIEVADDRTGTKVEVLVD